MTTADNSTNRIPEILQQVDLTEYNTLGVAATAKQFIEIRKKDELKSLADDGYFDRISPLILGGGSNILFRNDPDRPVLKISITGIEVIKTTDSHVWIKAGAGEIWHNLVKYAVDNNFGGIENLALIPGTVGAAPIQNIGAYGTEFDQVFSSLELYDLKQNKFREFNRDQCEFGYRDSIFKRDLKGLVVVTSVTMKLTRNKHDMNTEYYALKQWIEERQLNDPELLDIFDAVVAIRRSKLPDPSLIGNAGSFFKNPVVEKNLFLKLQKSYPEIPSFPAGEDLYKIPAGWLIEKCGWKGKRVGNVGTYKNQALVIVNHGGATGEELYMHALTIQRSVADHFGIELTPEVNIVE